MSVQDTVKVASKFLSHWRPAGRNFGAAKNMAGLCFQDTHKKQRSELESLVAAKEKLKLSFFLCYAQSTVLEEFALILRLFET